METAGFYRVEPDVELVVVPSIENLALVERSTFEEVYLFVSGGY